MYDDKHMLKIVQHATASALNNQEATATFLLLLNWMENSTNALKKTALTTRMFALSHLETPKDKSALHTAPLPAKQNTTPARSSMGHAHPSNLEQSCQGAT